MEKPDKFAKKQPWKFSHFIFILGFTLFLLTSTVHREALAGPVFIGLGSLDGGTTSSRAWGISADGSTVVGERQTASGTEAFRWTREEGMVGIGHLAGASDGSAAYGVSADGSVIVGASRSSRSGVGREAFRWTATTGMVGLGNLSPDPDHFDSVAFGVSADGSVVVGASGFTGAYINDGRPNHAAFRWTASEGMIDINRPSPYLYPTPNSNRSVAYDVSADGSVIAGRFTWGAFFDDFQAGHWTASTGWSSYPDPDPTDETGMVIAMTPDGSTLVGSTRVAATGFHYQAFRWSRDGEVIVLAGVDYDPPFENTIATAVSADGNVIVGQAFAPHLPVGAGGIPSLTPRSRAFIWDPVGGFRLLQDFLYEWGVVPEGWTLLEARGVSHDGLMITGTGLNPDGSTQAWLLDLGDFIASPPDLAVIPEPSSVILVGLGLLGIRVIIRRIGRNRPDSLSSIVPACDPELHGLLRECLDRP